MYLNLRIARLKAKVNQEQIAKLLGISVNTYGAKERGIYDFTLHEAKKLADYFGMSIESLFFDEM